MDCVTSFNISREDFTIFTNALECWDYAKERKFSCGVDIRKMNFPEKIKLCRWLNGNRCVNNKQIVTPEAKDFDVI